MLQDKLLTLESRFREEIARLGFVESGTLIGRPVQERALDRVLDLDHVLVVRAMELGKYHKIEDVLENIKDGTSSGLDVQYAIFDGPMKPHSDKENEVFFHIILHSPETYTSSPLLLCKNSWQSEKQFLGKSLDEYQRFPEGVTKKMLFESGLGLDSLLKMVSSNSSLYCGWEQSGNLIQPKVGEKEFNEIDERLELYFYSILRAASNTTRLFIGDNKEGIDLKMCANFQRTCGDFKYSRMPREIFVNKRLLRNKVLILSQGFVDKYQQKAMDFLLNLREYVEKRTS